MIFTGQGIFTGALTTAGAFLAMYFTNFKGIEEMGIICGGGLLLCLVPMMTLLPVLLLRGRQNVIDHSHKEDETRARIENFWLQRPALVIGIVVALVRAGRSRRFTRKVYFDYNLIEYAKPQPAVGGVRAKIDSIRRTNRCCTGAVVATNLDQAIALEEKLKKLTNTVADVDPPADMFENFIEQNQIPKPGLIRGIKEEVAPLEFNTAGLEAGKH